jgi:hypothetical protein
MAHPRSPMFDYVKRMNEAFGNRAGCPEDFDPITAADGSGVFHDEPSWARLKRQCENIGGKLDNNLEQGDGHINGEVKELLLAIERRDVLGVRDGLCDIMVFALGAFHFMGYDADADMQAVLDGVMTRFSRTQAELVDTVEKWTRLGVTGKAEGAFPCVIYRSDRDQTSSQGEFIPAGKFLKSASYTEPVFPPAPVQQTPGATRAFFGQPAALHNLKRRKDDNAEDQI